MRQPENNFSLEGEVSQEEEFKEFNTISNGIYRIHQMVDVIE